MATRKLARFAGHRYLNLETYKKDGTPVRTPVFFVEHQGVLYMRSATHTYKLKRIRNNPTVRVVPCDVRGQPLGEWMEGKAQLTDAADMQWVNDLVKKKYGLLKRLMDLRSRLKGLKFVVIAVHVR